MTFANISNGTESLHKTAQLSATKQTELSVWIVATLILTFIGAFNNIVVLVVTWPRATGTSGVNLLIFHYLATNLLMSLINIPIGVFLVQARRDGYFIPPTICNYVQAVYSTGAGVINWADAGLAINRSIALFFPHSYKKWTTKTVNLGMIAFAWVASLISTLPLSFGVGGALRLLALGQCTYVPQGQLGVFLATLFTYVPYTFAGLGACLILWKSYEVSRNRVAGNMPDQGAVDSKQKTVLRRLRMAKVLLLTFLWSAVCAVPWGVLSTNYPFVLTENPVSALWLRTAMASQYAFTPCILFFSNPEYRRKLVQIVRPGRSTVIQSNNSVTNTNHISIRKGTDEKA